LAVPVPEAAAVAEPYNGGSDGGFGGGSEHNCRSGYRWNGRECVVIRIDINDNDRGSDRGSDRGFGGDENFGNVFKARSLEARTPYNGGNDGSFGGGFDGGNDSGSEHNCRSGYRWNGRECVVIRIDINDNDRGSDRGFGGDSDRGF